MDQSRFHGLEFLVGGMYGLTLFSSAMSSPWTIRNVGADPEHAQTASALVMVSLGAAGAYGAMASYLDKTWWPLVGAAASGAFMWYLYDWALKGAQQKGYQGLNTFAGQQNS